MTSSSSVEQTSRALSDFLDRFSGAAKPQAMESLAATDLTLSQLRVLFVVGSRSVAVHEIAASIGLSLATTGRTVDHLVKLTLINRREDPDDRRVKRITLTAKGDALVAQQLSIHHELITNFVVGLPPELRQALTTALLPIVDSEVDYFDLTRPARNLKATS